MSITMSNPSDWPQFYQQNHPNRVGVRSSESVFGDHHHQGSSADATVVNTRTDISSSNAASSPLLGTGPAISSGSHLNPEGRVGKPVRRRSRASRRTPTTLLNTDTTNFRAMVQQFTGGPSLNAPSFVSGSAHPGGPNFGFSLGGRQPHLNPSSLIIPPTGFQLQFHHQQQQQQHHHHHPPIQQHQNQQSYMFSLNNNNNNNNQGAAADLFLQRLGGNHPRVNTEPTGSEGFVVEGVISSQVPPPFSRNNNNNNFLQ